MKVSRFFILVVAILALATCALLARDLARAEGGGVEMPRQMLVRVQAGGGSFLLSGDPLMGTDPKLDGGAIPCLQQMGYRVVSVHMTASAGVNPEQHAALVLLEK